MICKMYRTQIPPEHLSRFIKITKEKRTPLISKREGFHGTQLLTKPNGEFMLLTYWENEAQPKAWWDSPEHQKLLEETKGIVTADTPAIQDVFEVQDIGLPMTPS